jgi:hypothetical protein
MWIVGALTGAALFWLAGGAAAIGALVAGAVIGALGTTGGVITTGFAGNGILVAGGVGEAGTTGVAWTLAAATIGVPDVLGAC